MLQRSSLYLGRAQPNMRLETGAGFTGAMAWHSGRQQSTSSGWARAGHRLAAPRGGWLRLRPCDRLGVTLAATRDNKSTRAAGYGAMEVKLRPKHRHVRGWRYRCANGRSGTGPFNLRLICPCSEKMQKKLCVMWFRKHYM